MYVVLIFKYNKPTIMGCRSRGDGGGGDIPHPQYFRWGGGGGGLYNQQQQMKRKINDKRSMRVANGYYSQDDHQYAHFAISFS